MIMTIRTMVPSGIHIPWQIQDPNFRENHFSFLTIASAKTPKDKQLYPVKRISAIYLFQLIYPLKYNP